MSNKRSAASYLPDRLSLSSLREAAEHCEGCELFEHALQTVFGDGKRHAPIMLIGEMPGDEEDQQGRPFVGPAGSLLRGAMSEAGLAVDDVYLTNAVKHFRWEPKGRHRIHVKPTDRQVRACRPWLEAEIEVITPQIIVCLGATASQALLGSSFRVTRQRGEFLKNKWAPYLLATHHPSAILRVPDEIDRQRKHAELVEDLRLAAYILPAVGSS